MGKFDHIWEMREGGPYDGENANKIFKCTHCGGETHHRDGWDGEPDLGNCHRDCPGAKNSDWSPGRASKVYKRNFDAIFPDAPGAGL